MPSIIVSRTVSALPLAPTLARRRRPLAVALAVVALELLVARELAQRPGVVVGVVLAAFALAAALWRPALAFALALGTLAFVPVYASPTFNVLTLEPTACALWLVAIAVGARLLGGFARTRLTVVDVGVLAFFVLLLLPVLAGVEKRGDYINEAFLWAGPYLGTRLFVAERPDARALTRGLVALALLVVPFVVLELATGHNAFAALRFPGAGNALFGHEQQRLGQARAQGAFGHPIALAMFLGTALLLALGNSLHEARPRQRGRWLSAAVVLAVMIALTLSRTGFVLVGAGIMLLGLAAGAGRARTRLVVVVALVGALLVGASQALPREVPSPVKLIGGGSQEVKVSGQYRQRLLRTALEPDRLTALGNPRRQLADFVSDPRYRSIDNEYLVLAQNWGLVSLAGLLLVVLSLCVALWQLRREGLAAVVPAATLANFAALFFVAFITQQQVMVWLLVGATSALVAARRPSSRSAR